MKKWNEIPDVKLYSDGGAEPNPGKGGFGVILTYKGRKKEFYQGYKLTTNNRMELMGVIFGLEQLKTKSNVEVFFDSRYVVDGITKGWAERWKAKNWMRTKKEKAHNSDLWDRLLNAISNHNVNFNWVKGHAGHIENERCDELANMGIKSETKVDDDGYEPNEAEDKQINKRLYNNKGQERVLNVGDECRKCGDLVIKKEPKRKKLKPNQPYYFEYYLYCPKCKSMYMVEEAKRQISNTNNLFGNDNV